MPHNNIRCAVKEYRQRRGLSQEDLARAVGVGRQAVYDMESGRYLPNTAVALRLARVLGCSVETLFAEEAPAHAGKFHLLDNPGCSGSRLALAQVREKIVGVPLGGAQAMPFKLEASDGLLRGNARVDWLLPRSQLAKTLLVLGCDPALTVLNDLLVRAVPGLRAHTAFASSRRALRSLAEGNAHVAGTHFHNSGGSEGNLDAVRSLCPDMNCLVIAFSLQEEGLMVAVGNPLGLQSVEDLADGRVRFVNREEGAALRKLLDAHLARYGIPGSAVTGYDAQVHSHCEGAFRVAGNTADAALGLRVVAESFGLDFVPLATTRCDLAIPEDLCGHPGITALLDVLQSASMRKELNSLPGYDASATGRIIAG